MHHHWTTRVGAAFLALWFVLATAGLAPLHRCPVHDGPVADAMTVPAGHPMHGDASHSPAPDGHGSHQCTCLGECCVAGPAVMGAAIELTVVALVDWPAAPHPVLPAPARSRAPHRLPFANGPPAPSTVAS